jgi:hypothetical protein
MKNRNLLFVFLLLLTFILNSCGKKNRFEIDTNKNHFEVQIHRFDKDLLLLDTTNMKINVDGLYSRYPNFLPVFTSEILNQPSKDTAVIRNLFLKYLTDTAFTKVNQKVLQTFNDISDIKKEVSDAYSYIHFYFPEVKLPEVYFFVSGFNRSIMINNSFIAIGTDFYLGSDFQAYKSLAYGYMVTNMRRECLAGDLISATLFRMFRMNSTENRLLDNMLYRGKVLYLMSVFMPNAKPEEIIGYSKEQLNWSKTNEKQIWASIIDQQHLFSSDLVLIGKYVNAGPFTAPISQDSPGRLGSWIGLQIVESYMRKNSNVSLRDLMKENNYQKMLETSDYRP